MTLSPRRLVTSTFVLRLLFLVALFVTACRPAMADPPRVLPQPTATLGPVALPNDDAPHGMLTEWWYYTGHLFGADGRRYGFELVFFQAIRGDDNPPGYAAHFAITDPARGRFAYEERTGRANVVPGKLDLTLGEWSIAGQNGADRLRARQRDYALDVSLQPRKPVVLHGGTGLIDFGPAGLSYYYSRTRLDLSGTLEVEGRPVAVTGQAWMDHQWGNFLVAGGGWDWFAMQFEDGTELMLTQLRDPRTNQTVTFGTSVAVDGGATHLESEQVAIEPTATWRSPKTGATYPSAWRVRSHGRGLELTLTPTLPDQELDVGASTGTTYWEGQVEVTGTQQGRPLKGLAYVELTGYQ